MRRSASTQRARGLADIRDRVCRRGGRRRWRPGRRSARRRGRRWGRGDRAGRGRLSGCRGEQARPRSSLRRSPRGRWRCRRGAPCFDAFGEDERLQGAHAGIADAFVVGAVAVAGVLEEDGGGHLGPMVAEILLPTGKERGPGLRAQALPGAAIVDRREGAVPILRDKCLFQLPRAACAGQKIALPASRSCPIDIEPKQSCRCCKCHGSGEKVTTG